MMKGGHEQTISYITLVGVHSTMHLWSHLHYSIGVTVVSLVLLYCHCHSVYIFKLFGACII